MLNRSKPKGEICPKERIKIGSHNKLEPDITLKINERSVFVIEGYHIEFRENDEDEWGYIAFMHKYMNLFFYNIVDNMYKYKITHAGKVERSNNNVKIAKNPMSFEK